MTKVEKATSKGLKVHFDLNESGVLKYLATQHICENVLVQAEPEPESPKSVGDNSTNGKFSIPIPQAFSGDSIPKRL